MPLPATSIFTAEVIVKGIQSPAGSNAAPAINVFYYKRRSNAITPVKSGLHTVFVATVMAPILAAANVRYTPRMATVRWIDDALDFGVDFPIAGNGAIATDSEPSDDAVYVLLRTGLRGKNYRGSKHFAGSSEIDTTGDVLVAPGLARWQAVRDACAAVLTDAQGNVWDPVVFSRKLSQIKANPTVVIATPIVAALLDLNIGTMRRRRTKTVR